MTDSVQITPEATDEEVAAILAAVEVSTPRYVSGGPTAASTRWRWSGRWWSKPAPARRNRPW